MARYSADRRVEDLARDAVRRGWAIVLTGNKHLKWLHPSGAFFFSARTPGDHRTWKHVRAHIRRIERAVCGGAHRT